MLRLTQVTNSFLATSVLFSHESSASDGSCECEKSRRPSVQMLRTRVSTVATTMPILGAASHCLHPGLLLSSTLVLYISPILFVTLHITYHPSFQVLVQDHYSSQSLLLPGCDVFVCKWKSQWFQATKQLRRRSQQWHLFPAQEQRYKCSFHPPL